MGFIPHGNIIFSEGKVDWPYCGPIVMCWILMHFAPVIWCMNAVNCAWWRTVTVWVALIETLMLTYLLCPEFVFFFFEKLDWFFYKGALYYCSVFFSPHSGLHLNLGINSCVYCTYQYLWKPGFIKCFDACFLPVPGLHLNSITGTICISNLQLNMKG